jgi:hypothetical protein
MSTIHVRSAGLVTQKEWLSSVQSNCLSIITNDVSTCSQKCAAISFSWAMRSKRIASKKAEIEWPRCYSRKHQVISSVEITISNRLPNTGCEVASHWVLSVVVLLQISVWSLGKEEDEHT